MLVGVGVLVAPEAGVTVGVTVGVGVDVTVGVGVGVSHPVWSSLYNKILCPATILTLVTPDTIGVPDVEPE